jgi:hypothetical protein
MNERMSGGAARHAASSKKVAPMSTEDRTKSHFFAFSKYVFASIINE